MTEEAWKPKRKRIWKWIAALGLILCLTLAATWHSRKRGLLEQSTKVVTNHDSWRQSYRWLSDHQILVDRWQERERLYTYDLRTRQEICLNAVSQELNRRNFGNYLDALSVSPDGTRLLWSQFGPEPVHGVWLDGSHFFTSLFGHDSENMLWTQARWTSDSRRWVAFASNKLGATEAMIYDGDLAHQPEIVLATASDYSVPLEAMGMDNIRTDNPQSLVLGDHILTYAPHETQGSEGAVDIVDIGIGSHISGLKTRPITLPPNASIDDVVISPQGDRIAWHLLMKGGPDWLMGVQRRFPRLHVQSEWTDGLWVSRIDGAEMHEIGSIGLEILSRNEPHIDQMQWVPGSKRLSFMYADALYTVSAD